ncbi:MAG: beta-ketoacyl synthase N-terminal-like domain-containing protein, partial [Polyangiaceae bacterium]
MKIRAVVSSVGARTPVGLSATPTAYLHRAAHVVMQSSPILDADEQPATIAVLPTLDPRMTGTERAAELGVAALKEAIAPLVGIAKNERIKLLCCLDEHLDRPEAFDLTSKLSREAEKLGAELEVATSTRGPAALGHALDKILDELESGAFTLAIVGGVHTDYDPKRIHAFSTAGRLFTPDALDALIPGEAAAFVVLARGTNARRLGLPALLEVHDVATGMARAKPDNDESAFEATALTALVRKVAGPLTDAGLRCGW